MKTSNSDDLQNRLANETSPYLLQHANNPVDWYPWGEEALKKAEEEDKMLLISIGYSACHWCHVMEHESFEDEEVAAIMNANFVCIKVDREERPDVDQVYMNAIQLLTGSGGWPLNCFALPDGSPVYGGTYFPREHWKQVLGYMADIYKNESSKAVQQSLALKEGIGKTEYIKIKSPPKEYKLGDLTKFYLSIQNNFDLTQGGLGGAPKFPMPSIWLFLLRYHHFTGDQTALDQTLRTLDNMGNGGINDHLGGGFSRYATDINWNIPHFEKMLYDNGQLLSLYSEAYQLTRDEKYKEIVYDLSEYVSREMTTAEGAFYSSLDADSEGEEGKFYVWQKKDIQKLLGANADLFCDYYNVSESGNWEKGKNIFFISRKLDEVAKKYGLKGKEARQNLNTSREILMKKRKDRIPPGLDDKTLTSWNSLMIKGLTDAYRVFGEKKFLRQARVAAEFIVNTQTGKEYSLKRNYKQEKSSIPGFLDDYALTVDAFINLYKATFDEKWLSRADAYTEYTLKHFFDTASSMFYYTHIEQKDLVVRKMEIHDNVIPSSNSVMANNLFKLGKYQGKKEYSEIATQMLANVAEEIIKNGSYNANWGILLLNYVMDPAELAITGKNAEELRLETERHYLPEIILAGTDKESSLPLLENRYFTDKDLIYVCRDYQCELPVEAVEKAIELIAQ